jgi:hypothetical protein
MGANLIIKKVLWQFQREGEEREKQLPEVYCCVA